MVSAKSTRLIVVIAVIVLLVLAVLFRPKTASQVPAEPFSEVPEALEATPIDQASPASADDSNAQEALQKMSP